MLALKLLDRIGQYGRFVLVFGLIAAVALPELAQAIKDWLPQLVALLLFLNALRIGPVEAVGSVSEVRTAVKAVLVLQLALPCVLAVLFSLIGFTGSLATALVLMTSASSIAGSPNLAILTGYNPAPALRLLIIGTALLPATIIPVFLLFPPVHGIGGVLKASFNLFILIFAASALAFLIRHLWFKYPSKLALNALDGLSVLLMAFLVVGLMSALGPGLFNNFTDTAITLVMAFVANIGLQTTTCLLLGGRASHDIRVSYSIVAGNRNMALFLAALPLSVTDPILLFIGCYQIPMYLTPVLMKSFFKGISNRIELKKGKQS